jgi:hypothetical protein
MNKPMLGIIGICLLQVTFVAYNAVELPVDTSAVTPIREIAQATADLDQSNDDIVVFRSGMPVNNVQPRLALPTPALTATKRELRPAVKPEPKQPRVVLAVQRSRTRTEYPVLPLDYTESNKALSASVVTKQSKKKSFFSKALPIIKKPYDWAKAFAGKLK